MPPLARRARLMAQLKASNRIDFPDMSGFVADPVRVAQIDTNIERLKSKTLKA
jgi:hypothetical protein